MISGTEKSGIVSIITLTNNKEGRCFYNYPEKQVTSRSRWCTKVTAVLIVLLFDMRTWSNHKGQLSFQILIGKGIGIFYFSKIFYHVFKKK